MDADSLCKNCFACIFFEHEHRIRNSVIEIENIDRCILGNLNNCKRTELYKEHDCFSPSAVKIMEVDTDFNRKWESVHQAADYFCEKYKIPKKISSDD